VGYVRNFFLQLSEKAWQELDLWISMGFNTQVTMGFNIKIWLVFFLKPLLISSQKMNGLFMVTPIYKWLIITAWWFGTMFFFDFPYIGNVIIPTDDSSYFSEGLVETTNQKMLSILDLGYLNFLGNLHLFAERGPMDLGVISMNMPIHQAL